MPCRSGIVLIRYSSVRKPGASIVIQATRPGRLSLLATLVLPMGYQRTSHWMDASCAAVSL